MNTRRVNWIHAFILFVLIPLILTRGIPLVIGQCGIRYGWLVSILTMVAFFVITGHAVTNRFAGFLIDERNVISLSRFQIAGWTILILGSYLTLVLARLGKPEIDPMAIDIPQQLWALMGISMTSLVGSPLLLSSKKDKAPDLAETARTFDLLVKDGDSPNQLSTNGQLVMNKDIGQAKWTDLLTGEETSNAAHLDITRVQMLFFTLVALFAYSMTVDQYLGRSIVAPQISLPNITSGLLAIIAISHTGYLVAKASPRSKTGDALDSSSLVIQPSQNTDTDIPAHG